MYSNRTSFIYGFHGLDETIAYKILNKKENFEKSQNSYDWLGEGVYFWENNLSRAEQYAIEDSKRSDTKIETPFVLGAVIDLGNCLDLLDQKYLKFLKAAYNSLNDAAILEGKPLPENKNFNSGDFDFKKRELDCAVIRHAHRLACSGGESFDTVRAAFWEGEELYPGAAFKEQNHIQIAVLNPDCIKGVFLPREKADK